jgi:hypothetical protein
MRRLLYASAIASAIALLAPSIDAQGMDPDRVVPGGGIFGTGWKGQVPDRSSVAAGRTINDSKFTVQGNTITINAGPAGIYWRDADMAKGDYTVKATFTEPKVKSAMSHEHPYGIFIGGSKLGTPDVTLVYCEPYGNGRVLVRGFNPTAVNARGSVTGVFTLLPAAENPAVHKAAADGSVTQDVMWTVKGGKADCSINGTSIGSWATADIVGPGKLDSLDGIYGIRVSHNLDVTVTGFAKQ